MRNLPYNTGKVQIGLAYTPPVKQCEMGRDMLKLQDALIAKPRPSLEPIAAQVIGVALVIVASVVLFTLFV